MGMDSKKLSARKKQPGHDRSFSESEQAFSMALREILPSDKWIVTDKPTDLLKIIDNRYGIQPEASLEYRPSGRKLYFEVKKQGLQGNADERACKHHTVQFYRTMQRHTGYGYHPFVTIMCDSLATEDRYTTKHGYYFEPYNYFCWVAYDRASLGSFIEDLRTRWLA